MAAILSARLHALAAAHALVRPDFDTGAGEPLQPMAGLAGLVRAILKPNEVAGAERFIVEEPEISLGSRATTGLALVIHELATNAAKYGALVHEEGCVSVRWRQEGGVLAVQWRESGGPAVAGEPVQRGFGSVLARDTILRQLGGTLTLDWQEQGVAADFVLPLAKLAD